LPGDVVATATSVLFAGLAFFEARFFFLGGVGVSGSLVGPAAVLSAAALPAAVDPSSFFLARFSSDFGPERSSGLRWPRAESMPRAAGLTLGT